MAENFLNGGITMNDHDIWKFDLQLFADDPAPDTGSDELSLIHI